MKSGGLLIRTI